MQQRIYTAPLKIYTYTGFYCIGKQAVVHITSHDFLILFLQCYELSGFPFLCFAYISSHFVTYTRAATGGSDWRKYINGP